MTANVMDRVVLVLNPGKCGSSWLAQLLHLPPHLHMRGELDFQIFLTRPLREQWNRTVLESLRSRAIRLDPFRSVDAKLRALYALRMPPTGMLIDKSPSNLDAIPRFIHLFRGSKIILLYRDPRDIYVSKELYHQNVLKKKAPVERLGDPRYLASPECLLEDVFRLSRKLRSMERRLRGEGYDVLTVRYEDLVASFEGTALELLRFLGVPVEGPQVQAHVRARETARAPNFRKGGTGDWRNHLSSPEAKQLVKDRFGQDLVDLGYEHAMDW
jgi:hypothetical protein